MWVGGWVGGWVVVVVVRSPRSDFDELMNSTFRQKKGIHSGGCRTEFFTWRRFSFLDLLLTFVCVSLSRVKQQC